MSPLWWILSAVILPVLLAEFTEIAPWLADKLVRIAATALPLEQRSRYEEEWLAELAAIPGKVLKLGWAIKVAALAPSTGREMQGLSPLWRQVLEDLRRAFRLVGTALQAWSRTYRSPGRRQSMGVGVALGVRPIGTLATAAIRELKAAQERIRSWRTRLNSPQVAPTIKAVLVWLGLIDPDGPPSRRRRRVPSDGPPPSRRKVPPSRTAPSRRTSLNAALVWLGLVEPDD